MRLGNISLSAVTVMVAAMTFGAGRGFADSLIAKVPFDFEVQQERFPGGQYDVSRISNSGSPVLMLRNRESHKAVLLLTRNTSRDSKDARPRMVFQCGQAGCYLSEIWGATANGGVAVSPPRHPDASERMLVYMGKDKSGH